MALKDRIDTLEGCLAALTARVAKAEGDSVTTKDWHKLAQEVGWLRAAVAQLGAKSPYAIWPEEPRVHSTSGKENAKKDAALSTIAVLSLEERDKQAAEELFRQSCERALPAYIKERKAWAKEQSLANLSHRVSNMMDRPDPRMTDLDGLLIMREWLARVPGTAFTEKFAKWCSVNKALVMRFAHRLHEGEAK